MGRSEACKAGADDNNVSNESCGIRIGHGSVFISRRLR